MSTSGTALADANDRRHRATLSAAQNAIARLQRHGAIVTFGSVAKEAGVSRAWLYREPSIRELISRARSATDRPATARSPQRASADSLRQMTDALRAELVRLKQENHDLRQQLARKLGEQRAHSARQRPPLGEDMSTPSTPTTTRDPPTELEITVDLLARARHLTRPEVPFCVLVEPRMEATRAR